MALRFDAAGDRAYIAATLPDPAVTGLTVLGWWRVRVDRDDYSAYYRTSTGGSTIHTVETASTGLGVNIFTAAGEITETYVNAVDEWVGIAVVDNGSGTVIQYARPFGGGTVSNSGTIATGTPDLLCLGGRSQADATEWFNGATAHVRVFADTLSQSEVEAEWASTSAVLTAWADWPLAGDLLDTSGNDRDLTVVAGSPVFEVGPLTPPDEPPRVTVGTTPVQLTTSDTGPVGRRLYVRNTSSAALALGGDDTVSAGTGFLLAGGDHLTLPLSAGEELWAVRDGVSDVVVHVLRLGD